MMFGSPAAPKNSGPTERMISWEAPAVPATKAGGSPAEFLKGSLTIPAMLAFFRDNGRRILSLALGIFAIGVVILLLVPVRFAATALVVVDPREQRVTADQDVLPGIGQDAAALQSLIEIAKSDGFLRPLIRQLNVSSDADIAGGQTDETRLLEKFRARLDISRRGLTYVIGITFTSNRPQQAAWYANAVAEAFVAGQGRVRTDATEEAADWLNSRLKALNERLRASEDAVASFRLQHKIINAGKDSTTQQLRVTELTQQVSAARVRTEEARARYEQAQRDLRANVDGPVKQDLLSTLRAHRSALNDQIAQKRAVYGDRHPDLMISLSQLNDLNRQIEIERKKNIETAKSEYEAQLEQQRSLENQLKAVESQMLADGQALVRLQELQREADANRNIYEQFLSRFNATSEQRLLQNSQTKIASPAIAPARPTRPPLSLLLAALAAASLLGSTAIIGVMTSAPGKSRAVISPPPPARLPPAPPVWARIPDMRDAATSIWQKPLAAADGPDLGFHVQPLLEKIGGLPGAHGKVVLLLSVQEGSGATTVARSLNRAAVNRGMLSVMIDVQPEVAGVPPSAAAQGVCMTTADLRSVHELLIASKRTAPLAADDIRSEFDLIIVHAPPMSAYPDAASLAAHVDLVILVVAEKAVDSTAAAAAALLSRFGPAPVGLAINRVAAGPGVADRRRAPRAVAG
ncbi:MAG TPA: exopolysaccharide transport family protein [Bradyrhizobium sp.]|nr:exopolysaccharide transport family protein [Bradyrhizobium sp.]